MADITLRDITKDNWRECLRLKVAADQVEFVATNAYSLTQSKYEPHCIPQGIHDGDTMVGFTMYGRDPNDGGYWIYRIMVGEGCQGKGYGRVALTEVLRRLREMPDCGEVRLSYNPDNVSAAEWYARVGFRPTGELLGREIVARLVW